MTAVHLPKPVVRSTADIAQARAVLGDLLAAHHRGKQRLTDTQFASIAGMVTALMWVVGDHGRLKNPLQEILDERARLLLGVPVPKSTAVAPEKPR